MAKIASFASSRRCGADGYRLADWKLLLRGWRGWAHLCVHQRWCHLRHLAGSGALQPQRHCAWPNHGVSLSFTICQDAHFGVFFSSSFYHTWFVQMSWIHFDWKNHHTASCWTRTPEFQVHQGFIGMKLCSHVELSGVGCISAMHSCTHAWIMLGLLLLSNLYHHFPFLLVSLLFQSSLWSATG